MKEKLVTLEELDKIYYNSINDIYVENALGALTKINDIYKKKDYGYIIFFDNGESLKCASTHNLLCVDSDNSLVWKSANELSENDHIYYNNGGYIKVKKKIKTPFQKWIDFEIDDPSCSYKTPNGLINHNSGKSMIIYILIRYFQWKRMKTILLVPRVDLVTQMEGDFKEYFYKKENDLKKEILIEKNNIIKIKKQKELKRIHENRKKYNCEKLEDIIGLIYAGQEKNHMKPVTISTRSSLSINQGRVTEDYFKDFDVILNDECHTTGSETSKMLNEACCNAIYKVGLTGSLSNSIIENLTIEGLIGPLNKIISISEGIRLGLATNVLIKPIYLGYDEKTIKAVKKMKYPDEDKFLRNIEERNIFLAKLAIHQKDKNVILVFKNNDNGEQLLRYLVHFKDPNRNFNIKDYRKENDLKIYLTQGATKIKERDKFRSLLENSTGNILVASDKVITEGTNIKNVHVMIFSRINKKNTTIIQTCGRMVRLHKSKNNAIIYDIVDDLRYTTKSGIEYPNYSYKHFMERYETYLKEQFVVEEPKRFNLIQKGVL